MPVRTPEKKAVLVGIRGKPSEDFTEVLGAHKDVRKLWDLLIDTYQYKSDDIKLLMDKPCSPNSRNPVILPTTENIFDAMRDLVANKQAGDHIVFAFSGHGDQTPVTRDKNEVDNKDEGLVPLDYGGSEHPHLVLDDDIRKIFVDQLQEGVHCTLIFDCCHSGTACDLPDVQDVQVGSPVEVDGKPGGVGEAKGSLPNPRARGFTVDESLNHEHAANVTMEEGSGIAVVDQAETGPISRKEVTSWSACMDAQESFGGEKGGKFINELVRILKGHGKTITNRDLLLGLRRNLEVVFDNANKERQAQHRDDDPPVNLIPTPVPQLGSLTPDCILDEVFTL